MKSIQEAHGSIEWLRPDTEKKEFVLKRGNETVGTLTWGEHSAHAETADGTWTFHKHGFLQPHILVKDKHDHKVARFDATAGGGGVLEAIDGRHIRWAAHPWQADWHWIATGGNELISYKFSGFAVDGSPEGSITIHEAAMNSPHMPLVLLLGCYVIHLVAETAPR